MASKQWISAAVLAIGSAALPPAVLRAQVTQPVPAVARVPDTPADPKELVTADLSTLESQLIGPAPAGVHDDLALQQRRDEAARRLLSRGSPSATLYLLDALQNPGGPQDGIARRDARLAVARAIATDPQPDPRFINALLPLVGTERTLSDAAARALARYPTYPVAKTRLISVAQSLVEPANVRVGVVRAMGNVVGRDVADALVAFLNDPKQPPAIQSAAADALTELTGITAFGRNAQRWQQWRTANIGKADAVWQAEVSLSRLERLGTLDRAQFDTISELKQILAETYQQSPKNVKLVLVMRYLNSSDPRVREMGVDLVIREHNAAQPFPDEAPKRYKELVGDSDPGVRLIVAQVIYTRNDVDALDAILTQVVQEQNVDVKVAQIQALERLKKPRSVNVLLQLLHDPSLRVATAAAKALRETAATIAKDDPAAARALSDELLQAGRQRATEPGGNEFRAAAIEALGPLHDRRMVLPLLGLLNEPEARIRSAALRALGDIGDRNASFQITQWLAVEPSPAVRIDAINALASTSTFEDSADTLGKFMQPNTEPDEAVRNRAWDQFQSLLAHATNIDILNRWATNFQNDPKHRLPVLLALNDRLQSDMKWEDLAASKQNTGETYMKLGDAIRAQIQFTAALDYWQNRQVANQVTVTLVKQLIEAMLVAKDYVKLKDFAGKQLTLNVGNQTLFWSYIRDEVTRLYDLGVHDNNEQMFKDAASLIDNALKIMPPLAERFQEQLRQSQQQIQQRPKR